jgi:hypothetical protein
MTHFIENVAILRPSQEASPTTEDIAMLKGLAVVLLGLVIAGCGTVKEEVYLQGLDAVGNLPSVPLLVVDSVWQGQIQVSPRVSFMTGSNRPLTGAVPISGPRAPDTLWSYPERNLSWSIPRTNAGADLQIGLSRSVVLTGGFSTGSARGISVLDWNAGIGLIAANTGSAVVVRLDGGVHGQNTHVQAQSVVVVTVDPVWGSRSQSVYYYVDELDQSSLDFYAALTLNSRVPSWPVNFFLQGGYNRCTLASFEPSHQVHTLLIGHYEHVQSMSEFAVSLLSASGGIAVRVADNLRIVAGVRCVFTDVQDASVNPVWVPCLQIDFGLN